MQQLEDAESKGCTAVYAYFESSNKVKLAFSKQEAASGGDTSHVITRNSFDTLVDNLADAEWHARHDAPPSLSLSDRLARARSRAAQRAGTPSKRDGSSTDNAIDLASSSAYNSHDEDGQSVDSSGGSFIGYTGMVRSKRVRLMLQCFVNSPRPIMHMRIGQPHIDEFSQYGDIELPGSTTYMVSRARASGNQTIDDYLRERTQSIKAWPLMKFTKFLAFCRHVIKLCNRSDKYDVHFTVASMNELVDIAIRLHGHMSSLNQLGENESRLTVRLFLHLQHATMTRKLYSSAAAMVVFKEATELFLARIPDSQLGISTDSSKTATAQSQSGSRSSSKTKKSSSSKPKFSCWLCPSKLHYCNDRSCHPVNSDGKYSMPSDESKKKILALVDASTASQKEKSAEKAKIKTFWEKRCAP